MARSRFGVRVSAVIYCHSHGPKVEETVFDECRGISTFSLSSRSFCNLIKTEKTTDLFSPKKSAPSQTASPTVCINETSLHLTGHQRRNCQVRCYYFSIRNFFCTCTLLQIFKLMHTEYVVKILLIFSAKEFIKKKH